MINIVIIVLTFLFQFIQWEGLHYQQEKQHTTKNNHQKSWENLNNLLHTFSTLFILSVVGWLLTFSI